MTTERAVDIGSAALASGSATFLGLARGSHMDQWLMWVLSTVLAMVGAYGTFRVTTEKRLTHVETRLETTATTADVASLHGDIAKLALDGLHKRDVIERIDRRLEAIAARMGLL